MLIQSTTLTFLQNYKFLKDNAKFHGFLGHGLPEVQTCDRVHNNGIKILHSGCYDDLSSTTTTYSANITRKKKEYNVRRWWNFKARDVAERKFSNQLNVDKE